MTRADLLPLEPELAALVRAEHERPEIPSEVARRLAARLAIDLPATRGTTQEPPSVAPSTHRQRFHRIRFGVAAFALGGLVGTALHANFSHTDDHRLPLPRNQLALEVAQPRKVSPPPDSPVGEKPSSVGLPKRPPHKRGAPPAPPPAAIASERDDDLDVEHSLVEMARSAALRGELSDCLAALDRSQARFPNGRLIEERETLRVQALVRLGRQQEARDRATQFRDRYPNSLMLPVVESAIRPEPTAEVKHP